MNEPDSLVGFDLGYKIQNFLIGQAPTITLILSELMISSVNTNPQMGIGLQIILSVLVRP